MMINHQSAQKVERRGTEINVPRFFIGVLILSFFVSGTSVAKKNMAVKKVADQLQEARLTSIPLPVGGVLVKTSSKRDKAEQKSVVLTYKVTGKRETLVVFYNDEMMRFGWQKLAHASGDEETLVFESPLKIAIIQMRPERPKKGWGRNKKMLITLYEMVKEEEADL